MFSEEYQRWGWPESSILRERIHKPNILSLTVQTPEGPTTHHRFTADIPPPPYTPPLAPTPAPQQPATQTPLQSFAPLPVRRNTCTAAPAPALTYAYSSSPPHPPSRLPSSGSVTQPPPFPIPSVLGRYSAASDSSVLVPPPSPPMMERATTTYAHDVHLVGYQNVAAPGVSHQRSATMGWSHGACIVYGVPAMYA